MAHILIAEDDQSMCSFLQLALEKAGHNVQIAYNGIDALKIIEESNPHRFTPQRYCHARHGWC